MIRSRLAIGVFVFLCAALSVPPNFTGQPAGKGAATARFVPLSKRSVHTAALLRSYGGLVENVEVREDDVVFTVRGKEIHYRGGRMLSGENLARAEDFDSIFYEYGTKPARPCGEALRRVRVSDDFPDALVGASEREVRASCRWVDFLGRRVFVHSLCADALERVDARVREHARTSPEVRAYIAGIKVAFSMKQRYVLGTRSKSYHAYGLAIDVIPRSYGRKAAYWRWSAELRDDWGAIPPSERWQPPQAVIDAFEENGFVWGGKWYRFDTVHFEYRPEILASRVAAPPPGFTPPPE